MLPAALLYLGLINLCSSSVTVATVCTLHPIVLNPENMETMQISESHLITAFVAAIFSRRAFPIELGRVQKISTRYSQLLLEVWNVLPKKVLEYF